MEKSSTSSLVRCPYLAAAGDEATYYAFPTGGNLCHACDPAEAADLGHQATYCLTEEYAECPLYSQSGAQPMPASIALNPAPPVGGGQRLVRYGLLVLGLAFLAFAGVWGVQTLLGDDSGATPRASAGSQVTLLPTEASLAVLPSPSPTVAASPTARAITTPLPTATLPSDGGYQLQPTTTVTWPPTPVGTLTPIPSATAPFAATTVASELALSPSRTPPPSATPPATTTPSPAGTPAAEPLVRVSSPFVNLRTGPGPQYPIIRALRQGLLLQPVARNNSGTWLNVVAAGGLWGWVYTPLITPLDGVDLAAVPVASVIPPPPTSTSPPPTETATPLPLPAPTDEPPPPVPTATLSPPEASATPVPTPVPSLTPVPPPVPTATPIPPPAPTPTPIPPP